MAYKQKHFKQKPHFQKRTPRKAAGPQPLHIDYAALPADLDEEAYEDLIEGLPKSKRKTKPKPMVHAELLALNSNQMHELADEEKHKDFNARNRRDAIWEITQARLNAHIPVLVEGVVDIWDKTHYFLRTHYTDYMPAAEDVYVPPSLVDECGLERGMTVQGFLRPNAEGEKYLCLHEITQVDGTKTKDLEARAAFRELVPLYPDQRIMLEDSKVGNLEMRILDLITPIGRGQRGLIVAPPRTGKTVLLHMLANSILHNAPDCKLIILLVDERPEEVTDFQRSIEGDNVEVVSSTFDEPASRHILVAEMVITKAKSMVEAGQHVVILLDSITRLARACNTEAPSNGKLLSGGLEATALQFPKQFFGAARNIENGGSLTILGTALVETGSKMDEVIFEEFKGTGNMEIVLDRRISDRRIYPAVDINRSGTRKEELLFTPGEIERVWMLRKVLNELDPVEAMEMLIAKMRKTNVNAEFLMTIGG
ncbi:MAG TPA: transcription termination factor Rho [Planctomycetota bacterium]|nr:transcription termination factor Rho [Planctomycetota bacterium]